jgi:hypothetical protein
VVSLTLLPGLGLPAGWFGITWGQHPFQLLYNLKFQPWCPIPFWNKKPFLITKITIIQDDSQHLTPSVSVMVWPIILDDGDHLVPLVSVMAAQDLTPSSRMMMGGGGYKTE